MSQGKIDVYSDQYWEAEFTVTQADMGRLERYIADTGQAHDLTVLTKRIIRGRLRHGHEVSPAVVGIESGSIKGSVRLWDPTLEWQVGDHAIVAVNFWHGHQSIPAPYVGEITAIEGPYAKIYVEVLGETRSYGMSPSPKELSRWRRFLNKLIEDKRQADDSESDLELILLEHGERATSQLLDALKIDERFVRLSGRWFLRRLAQLPSEEQVRGLAWGMLKLVEPQPTEALPALLPLPVAEGDPGLFGLYLAMQGRPGLFANADPGQRPRWVLVGPPPGPVTAHYAAYDPESYHVLSEPGERIEEGVAQRLWELKLFTAICQAQG